MGILAIVVALMIGLVINFIFASLMNDVAESKGHKNSHAFALVFFLGVFGMLYVIALPDLVARQQREDLLAVLLSKDKGEEN